MKEEEIDQIKARNVMLESDNRILANKVEKQNDEIKKLEKIIKEKDLEIQRLINGTQQKLF